MRNLTQAYATASIQQTVRPFKAVELLFDNGPLRLWNGHVATTINGNTYYPTAGAGYFSQKKETDKIMAEGLEIGVSLTPEAIALAQESAEVYQGRIGKCYVLLVAADDTLAGIDTIFTGRMSRMDISDGANGGQVVISLESHMVDLNRSDEKYYTEAQQKIDHPTDTAFRFKDACVTVNSLPWGTAKNAPPTTSPTQRIYPTIN